MQSRTDTQTSNRKTYKPIELLLNANKYIKPWSDIEYIERSYWTVGTGGSSSSSSNGGNGNGEKNDDDTDNQTKVYGRTTEKSVLVTYR